MRLLLIVLLLTLGAAAREGEFLTERAGVVPVRARVSPFPPQPGKAHIRVEVDSAQQLPVALLVDVPGDSTVVRKACVPAGPGKYAADVMFAGHGPWRVRVEVATEHGKFQLVSLLEMGKGPRSRAAVDAGPESRRPLPADASSRSGIGAAVGRPGAAGIGAESGGAAAGGPAESQAQTPTGAGLPGGNAPSRTWLLLLVLLPVGAAVALRRRPVLAGLALVACTAAAGALAVRVWPPQDLAGAPGAFSAPVARAPLPVAVASVSRLPFAVDRSYRARVLPVRERAVTASGVVAEVIPLGRRVGAGEVVGRVNGLAVRAPQAGVVVRVAPAGAPLAGPLVVLADDRTVRVEVIEQASQSPLNAQSSTVDPVRTAPLGAAPSGQSSTPAPVGTQPGPATQPGVAWPAPEQPVVLRAGMPVTILDGMTALRGRLTTALPPAAVVSNLMPASRGMTPSGPPQPMFVLGQEVTLRVRVAERVAALCVPREAVKDGAVYVVEDGVARLRAVKTGLSHDTHTEVLSGLQEGETIAAVADPDLRDGASVTPGRIAGNPLPGGKGH